MIGTKALFALVAVGALGVGGFFAFNNYIYQQKQAPAEQYMSLSGTTWHWVRTDVVGRSPIVPKEGTEFTLTFGESQVSGTTDCNSLMGSYTRDDTGTLTFGPLAMTKMFCEGSMEGEYAGHLAGAVAYTVQDGSLHLSLGDDAGTMIFQAPGGSNYQTILPMPPEDMPVQSTPPSSGGGSSPGYNPDYGVVCTADAMMCPDGSYVGRSGPNCRFVCPQ